MEAQKILMKHETWTKFDNFDADFSTLFLYIIIHNERSGLNSK